MTLKALQIQNAKAGMHADGNGLYLRVQDSGARSWIFRYQLNGKRREMGIGTLDELPAVQARQKAAILQGTVRSGIDPIDQRRTEAALASQERQAEEAMGVSFQSVAEDYIRTHRAGWKNPKHTQQWENTLATYAYPIIGKKAVGEVSTEDVLRVLQPIWQSRTETASRLRGRIEVILSYAKVRKLRHGENSAMWRGHLDSLLPAPGKLKRLTSRHHPALPYQRMAEFITALRVVDGTSARALEFAILTACRSVEVRGMLRSEVDFDAATWTIPASRMKAGREHRIPLSAAALAIIKAMPIMGEAPDLVFPSDRKAAVLSDMTLTQTIRRMDAAKEGGWRDRAGDVITAHGFRSTFRDWAGETTSHAREVIEHALAHQLADKAEAAYARGTLFDKRRQLMEDWAAWCQPKEGNVVSIKSKTAA